MWPLLGLALVRVESGPDFCLIRASGFSMALGRLTLRCGFFVPADGCGQSAAGSVLGVRLIIGAGLDWSQKLGLVYLACLGL